MYRISSAGQEPIVDVDTVHDIEPEIRSSKPGRDHVDQIEAYPLLSGHTEQRRVIGIKRADGSVVIERDPWEK
jgi:hypothetical protein